MYIIQIIYPRETFLVQIIGLSHSNNLRGGKDCPSSPPTVTACYTKDRLCLGFRLTAVSTEQVWLHKKAWLRGVLDIGVQI